MWDVLLGVKPGAAHNGAVGDHLRLVERSVVIGEVKSLLVGAFAPRACELRLGVGLDLDVAAIFLFAIGIDCSSWLARYCALSV